MNKLKLFLISVLLSIIMCFPAVAGNITTSRSGNTTTVHLTGTAPRGSEGPTYDAREHCLNVAFFLPQERFDGVYVWSFASNTCATTTTMYSSGPQSKPCNSALGVQLRPRKPGLNATVDGTEKPYTTCKATGIWATDGNYDVTLIVTDLNPKLTKIGIAKSRWLYQCGSNPAGWDGHFLGDYVEYSCINRNGVLQNDYNKVVGGVALC